MPLHQINWSVLYPPQTVSCKFGCSRAEDAYGVEAQSKSEWSPMSNSQPDKVLRLWSCSIIWMSLKK